MSSVDELSREELAAACEDAFGISIEAGDIVFEEDEACFRRDLTAFQRDIMRVNGSLGAVKGLDIKDAIEARYGTEIRHGRLYPNLDTLAERGLITKGEIDGRTNRYELTSEGRAVLRGLGEWNPEVERRVPA